MIKAGEKYHNASRAETLYNVYIDGLKSLSQGLLKVIFLLIEIKQIFKKNKIKDHGQ